MAEAVADGARVAGTTGDVRRVPETVPDDVARGAHDEVDQAAPIANVADLEQERRQPSRIGLDGARHPGMLVARAANQLFP